RQVAVIGHVVLGDPDGLEAQLFGPHDLLQILPVETVVGDRPFRWIPEVVPDAEPRRTYEAPLTSRGEPVRWRAGPGAGKLMSSASSGGGPSSPIASPARTASSPPNIAAAFFESTVSTTPGAIT